MALGYYVFMGCYQFVRAQMFVTPFFSTYYQYVPIEFNSILFFSKTFSMKILVASCAPLIWLHKI